MQVDPITTLPDWLTASAAVGMVVLGLYDRIFRRKKRLKDRPSSIPRIEIHIHQPRRIDCQHRSGQRPVRLLDASGVPYQYPLSGPVDGQGTPSLADGMQQRLDRGTCVDGGWCQVGMPMVVEDLDCSLVTGQNPLPNNQVRFAGHKKTPPLSRVGRCTGR